LLFQVFACWLLFFFKGSNSWQSCFQDFGTLGLFLLHHHEHLIRNNGLMGIGAEVPLHEAIVFNLGSANTDCFLKQHSVGPFLVGKQFVDCFPVSPGSAGGKGDALRF